MSEIKVNKISPRSGTAFTLGDSGDTFTLPSGGTIAIAAGATINNQGTAVNFGATGSASWVTTVKTGDFTAVAGEGYFVNTTSGEITVTLPASPSAGAVVAVKDYANTFDTNKCTLARNGSNIGGQALNSTLTIEGLAVTLVYVDATKGWLVTDSGLQSEAPGPQYFAATGGNTTATSPCGDFKIHTFTGPGTFCVSSAGNAAGSNTVEYIVSAGGGGGGTDRGGGGGGGGFRFASPSLSPATYPGKPLAAPAVLTMPVAPYPISVGGGGAAGGPVARGTPGTNSILSNITSAGGGGGGGPGPAPGGTPVGIAGGSGGGGKCNPSGSPTAGGAGNTPPVSPPQGNPGGPNLGGEVTAGGGGGAIATGTIGGPGSRGDGGNGAGVPNAFGTSGQNCGSFYYFSGGGGGGGGDQLIPLSPNRANGGLGGGGLGGTSNNSTNLNGAAGTTNTGGGGGGGGNNNSSAAGGSGIVIIRYKFQ